MQLVVIKPVNHLWYYVTYKLHTCIVTLFTFILLVYLPGLTSKKNVVTNVTKQYFNCRELIGTKFFFV